MSFVTFVICGYDAKVVELTAAKSPQFTAALPFFVDLARNLLKEGAAFGAVAARAGTS